MGDNGRSPMNAKEGSWHKELMLTTDLCLAYKTNPGYDDCMVRERENGDRYGSEFKCREEVKGKSIQLDPTYESCCTWTCITTLQKTYILNFTRKRDRIEEY